MVMFRAPALELDDADEYDELADEYDELLLLLLPPASNGSEYAPPVGRKLTSFVQRSLIHGWSQQLHLHREFKWFTPLDSGHFWSGIAKEHLHTITPRCVNWLSIVAVLNVTKT